MRLAVALLLLVPLLAGCSGGGDEGHEPLPAEWRGRDLRKPGWVNETVQPGWTLAMQYDWSGGTRVAWDWFVYEPIFAHFQLVRMQGSDPSTAQPVAASDAQEGEGERTVVQSGTHQIDWMNEFSQPITIAHKVPSGGTRIQYRPGQGPGCLFAPGTDDAAASCLRSPLPA